MAAEYLVFILGLLLCSGFTVPGSQLEVAMELVVVVVLVLFLFCVVQDVLRKHSVIVTRCCVCKKLMGYKDGLGNWGISDTYCEPCGDELMREYT